MCDFLVIEGHKLVILIYWARYSIFFIVLFNENQQLQRTSLCWCLKAIRIGPQWTHVFNLWSSATAMYDRPHSPLSASKRQPVMFLQKVRFNRLMLMSTCHAPIKHCATNGKNRIMNQLRLMSIHCSQLEKRNINQMMLLSLHCIQWEKMRVNQLMCMSIH